MIDDLSRMGLGSPDAGPADPRSAIHHVVGTSPPRFGGAARVTGRQRYVADIRMEGVLHAKLITLPCARARILGIDAAAASRVPGFRFLMTAGDLPQPVPRFGMQFQDRPVLAAGETTFHGEPVGAVAAETRDAAEAAARLVRVDYEVLPAVTSVAAALDPASHLVQDPALHGTGRASNVLSEYRFGWGDVEAADADLVVEHTYSWPMMTHFAIEPHACIAAPEGDGIVVWSTIQHPYQLQRTLARVLGLPLAKVRVIAPIRAVGSAASSTPSWSRWSPSWPGAPAAPSGSS